MIEHLKHMANVRPGRDGAATKWAVGEIERMRAEIEVYKAADYNALYPSPENDASDLEQETTKDG